MEVNFKKRLPATDYTVAIICPLEVEMSAMRYMLDEEHERLPRVKEDLNRYVFGELSGHNVVIGYLPHGSQGVGFAATVATHMKRTFPSIKLRLLVGLAGGIPTTKNDIRLGDVVVSMPEGTSAGVVQYDLGKTTITGFERKGYLQAPQPEWRDAVVLMMSDHRLRQNRVTQYITEMVGRHPQLKTYERPVSTRDVLFPPSVPHIEAETTCEKCNEALSVRRPSRESDHPEIFFGLVASGDMVMKDPVLRDRIGKEAGGALAFEMEAAGLMLDFQCLVIRGICDYADSHKNDKWHHYGAAVAAACAKELMSYIDPIQDEYREVEFPTIEPKASVSRATTFSTTSSGASRMSQPSWSSRASSARYFIVPKQQVKDFVGRENELETIETYFSVPDSDQPKVIVVHALGGQGKSQLVLKYCYTSKHKYHGIFWVNACSMPAVKQSLLGIAKQLDHPESLQDSNENDKLEYVIRTLSSWEERWMMVYDNVDDPNMFDTIRDYIPNAGKGDILLTSCHRGLEQLGMLLELPPMPPEAGVALLLSACPNIRIEKYLEVCTRIVNRLGGLALAIKQAASFIQQQHLSAEGIETFLQRYEAKRKLVLQHTPSELWEYGALHKDLPGQNKAINAFTTWEMALHYLSARHVKEHAAMEHVLTLAAFLAPISISESIFKTHFDHCEVPPYWMKIFSVMAEEESDEEDTEPLTEDSAAGLLWNHDRFGSFVSITKKHSLTQISTLRTRMGWSEFSLHPLIRDWLQLRIKRARSHEYLTEAIEMIANSVQASRGPSGQTLMDPALLCHADAVSEIYYKHGKKDKQLRRKMADNANVRLLRQYCFDAGRYDSCRKLCEIEYSTVSEEHGLNDFRTVQCMIGLARALEGCGHYDKASEWFRQVLEVRENTLGRTHPQTLETIVDLSSALTYSGPNQDGQYAEAGSLLDEVLQANHLLLGSADPIRLKAMNNMAFLLHEQGRTGEAERMCRRALGLYRSKFGEHHANTVMTTYNLALFVSANGKHEESQRLLREVMEQRSGSLAAETPLKLNLSVGLAISYRAKGDLGTAERILQETTESLGKVLGREHPNTIGSMSNLVFTLKEQRKYGEAIKLGTETLSIASRSLGMQNLTTQRSSVILADMLRTRGDDDLAIIKTLKQTIQSTDIEDDDLDKFLDDVVVGQIDPAVRSKRRFSSVHDRTGMTGYLSPSDNPPRRKSPKTS